MLAEWVYYHVEEEERGSMQWEAGGGCRWQGSPKNDQVRSPERGKEGSPLVTPPRVERSTPSPREWVGWLGAGGGRDPPAAASQPRLHQALRRSVQAPSTAVWVEHTLHRCMGWRQLSWVGMVRSPVPPYIRPTPVLHE